jgi:hypothetical protein
MNSTGDTHPAWVSGSAIAESVAGFDWPRLATDLDVQATRP